MGIDSNLKIQTENLDEKWFSPLILKGIVNFSKSMDLELETKNISIEKRYYFNNSEKIESVSYCFKVGEEKRRIFVCFLEPNSKSDYFFLHLSLGHWGSAEEILFYIGMEFSSQYNTFFQNRDDNQQFKLLSEHTDLQKKYLKNKIKNIS